MSKYSTELRFVLESNFNLGMDEYPIFSEEYRDKLNSKIFKHFYFHEIGFETVPMFKHYLNQTMDEIMPYYNKLYVSELLEINPLLSYSKTKTETKTTTAELTENLSLDTQKIGEDTIDKTLNSTIEKDGTNTNVINKTIDGTVGSVSRETSELSSETNIDETQTKTINETQDVTINDDKQTTLNATTGNKKIFSDTPQSLITDANLSDNFYATNATIDSGTNETEENVAIDKTDNTVKTGNIETIVDNTTGVSSNASVDVNKTDTITNTESTTDTLTIDETHTNSQIEGQTKNTEENVLSTQDNTRNKTETIINNFTESGYSIPLSDLLSKYRSTFINIDMQIIKELETLFMMVY